MADFNAFGGAEEENAEIKKLTAEVVRTPRIPPSLPAMDAQPDATPMMAIVHTP
jgi:hypothetical protein